MTPDQAMRSPSERVDARPIHHRCRNRGEQHRLSPYRIESPAGDAERDRGRCYRHDPHMHRHVRGEGAAREPRKRPEPDRGESEEPEREESGAHYLQLRMNATASAV